MNFTVKYRGSDGTPQTEVVSAASRADVFAQMKARGVTPTSVVEGGRAGHVSLQPNSAEGRKPSRPHPAWLKGALAGILVVILAGGAFWFLARPTDAPAEKPLPKKVEKKPAKVEPLTTHRVTNRVAKVEEKVPEKTPDAELLARREKMKKMTPEQRLDYLFERAKERPLNTTPGKGRIYATALEQAMDWVFSCEVGNPPPLLPKMTLSDEAHLAEILVMDNPINEGDSEKVKESKEMMKVAKKEFRDFIKNGGDPYDFLPFYHSKLVQAHAEYKTARESVVNVVRKEPDIAPEYIKKVNAELAAKGIKTIKLPQKMLDAFHVVLDD